LEHLLAVGAIYWEPADSRPAPDFPRVTHHDHN